MIKMDYSAKQDYNSGTDYSSSNNEKKACAQLTVQTVLVAVISKQAYWT